VLLLLAAAGFWAGAQNALAGGGSFITFPALLLAGLDPRAANITSTIALFPGQIAMSWSGRRAAGGVGKLSLKALFAISLAGGILGALLLLATPASFFARLVPWLVLFATLVFALGDPIRRRLPQGAKLPPWVLGMIQLGISIYGGYFGGGIGFLMLAALTAAGLAIRNAGATKNLLAGAMNFAAVTIFIFSPQVHWLQTSIACIGALIGGLAGAHMLNRVNEKLLRIVITVIGVALTVGLFLRAP